MKDYKEKIVGDTKVILEESDCPDDGGKWVLICEKHAGILQDTNKRRLWWAADEVDDWCCKHAREHEAKYPMVKN